MVVSVKPKMKGMNMERSLFLELMSLSRKDALDDAPEASDSEAISSKEKQKQKQGRDFREKKNEVRGRGNRDEDIGDE